MKHSGSTFGKSDEDWDAAVGELRGAILAAAPERRMTTYTEIANQIMAFPVEPHSALMNHLLGAVYEREHAAGRPALTAIVTDKQGDLGPGPGSYEMSRVLGYRFNEAYVFWSTQMQNVFTTHGRPGR